MAIGLSKISGTIESSESVATSSLEWASDTGGTLINAGSGELVLWAELQITVAFGSSTDDAILHVRTSVDDATTESTEEVGTAKMTFENGDKDGSNNLTQTYKVYNFDYLDVGMENSSASQTITWTCKYVGLKITGLS